MVLRRLLVNLKCATAKMICRSRALENALVRISRRYPRSRIIRSLSCAVGNGMLSLASRRRTTRLNSGPRMIMDPADIFRDVYFLGTYEPEVTELILGALRPGDVAFDIGANAGYYTLLMAGIVGHLGHVHAFEPNPELVSMLNESVALNSFEARISVNQIAVAKDTERQRKFYLSQLPENSGVSALKPHTWGIAAGAYSGASESFVDTIALDDYVRQQGIRRCDLVKIDVEGTEADVIFGMCSVLRELQPRVVICETGTPGEADALLLGHGYRRYIPTGSGLEELTGDSFWGNLVYVCPRSGNIATEDSVVKSVEGPRPSHNPRAL